MMLLDAADSPAEAFDLTLTGFPACVEEMVFAAAFAYGTG
jgi:hypothetical protein